MKKLILIEIVALSLLVLIAMYGCKNGILGDDCDNPRDHVPSYYQEIDKFKQGDYESRTYRSGGNYIGATTTDGCSWEWSEYHSYY